LIDHALVDELLARWPVARLATVDKSGQPHLVPIVFCRDGNALYSPVDGKRKKTGQLKRLANLAANPKTSLLIDEYHQDWQKIWWLRLDGRADVYNPEADHEQRLTDLFTKKYPQYRQVPLTRGELVCLRFEWDRTISWAQGDINLSIQRTLSDLDKSSST
jgi:PPOX class probable F420-dependent enzyme